jgi:hypothetical protein
MVYRYEDDGSSEEDVADPMSIHSSRRHGLDRVVLGYC